MTIGDDVVAERLRLVATLRAVGPDAPTMAGTWNARQLASHLAAQDRFGGWPAFVARRLVVATNLRLSAAYLDRPKVAIAVNGPTRPWERSLRMLSQPPPGAVRRDPVAVIALWEHFVHHEDVRRRNGLERSELPAHLGDVLRWVAGYGRRRLDRPVRLLAPDGSTVAEVGAAAAGSPMEVQGALDELVLWLSGRSGTVVASDAGDDELERLRVRLRG